MLKIDSTRLTHLMHAQAVVLEALAALPITEDDYFVVEHDWNKYGPIFKRGEHEVQLSYVETGHIAVSYKCTKGSGRIVIKLEDVSARLVPFASHLFPYVAREKFAERITANVLANKKSDQ